MLPIRDTLLILVSLFCLMTSTSCSKQWIPYGSFSGSLVRKSFFYPKQSRSSDSSLEFFPPTSIYNHHHPRESNNILIKSFPGFDQTFFPLPEPTPEPSSEPSPEPSLEPSTSLWVKPIVSESIDRYHNYFPASEPSSMIINEPVPEPIGLDSVLLPEPTVYSFRPKSRLVHPIYNTFYIDGMIKSFPARIPSMPMLEKLPKPVHFVPSYHKDSYRRLHYPSSNSYVYYHRFSPPTKRPIRLLSSITKNSITFDSRIKSCLDLISRLNLKLHDDSMISRSSSKSSSSDGNNFDCIDFVDRHRSRSQIDQHQKSPPTTSDKFEIDEEDDHLYGTIAKQNDPRRSLLKFPQSSNHRLHWLDDESVNQMDRFLSSSDFRGNESNDIDLDYPLRASPSPQLPVPVPRTSSSSTSSSSPSSSSSSSSSSPQSSSTSSTSSSSSISML